MNIISKKFMKVALTALPAILMTASTPPLAYAAPPTQQAIQPNFKLGMNFLWDKGNAQKLESSFQRMQAMGIKTARTDFEWRDVEKVKGVYNWGKLDKLVKLAHQHNVELLPIVHYAPKWAVPRNVKKPEGVYELALSEESYDEYSDFLNAAIDRYGPKGNAPIEFTPIQNWQIWNEPNIKEFWYVESGYFKSWDMPKAADKFVDFMKVVTDGLGQRRDDITVVHAGLSKSDISYMWHLWDNDPSYGDRFDVMAVHSYFFNPQGGVRPVDSIDKDDKGYAPLGFIGSKDDHGYLQKIFNVKLFMDLKKTPKPVWVTEIGFMANETGPTSKNPWVIKEDKALSITAETLKYFQDHKQRLGIDRVYWFVLDDYNFPHDMGNFGVYRSNGSARSAIKNTLDAYTPE